MITANETYIQLDASTTLRDICFVNDSIVFVCGGSPGKNGTIWQSKDGGRVFNRILDVPQRCIYDIDFGNNNNGYAGGDDVLLLHTTDGGLTWKNEFENHDFSEWQEFITPIRKVRALGIQWVVAVGGDTYYKGIMCNTWNWGQNWTFRNYDNQLNDMVMPGGSYARICGYGRMFASTDTCRTLHDLDVPNDHFTGIDFYDNNHGIACGYNGGIYLTTDGGTSWKTALEPNGSTGSRKHLNDVTFTPSHNAVVVGANGLILYSSDGGTSWATVEHDVTDDLFCVHAVSDTEFLYCGAGGRLYRINLMN
ncbi:MAG: YCF48-related protein [Bacteroidota bacterium]